MIPVSYGHLPARQHWNEGYLQALKDSRTMGPDSMEKLIAELEAATATKVCEPDPAAGLIAQLEGKGHRDPYDSSLPGDTAVTTVVSKAEIAAAREELRKEYECHLI